MRRRARAGTAFLVLASVAASLAAAELVVRRVRPQPIGFSYWTRDGLQIHIPGRSGIYRRSEFAIPVRFNAHGFRGGEFAIPKPAGVFRVLALGDSVTEGMQVVEDRLFTTRLERTLAPAGMRMELLNLGVSGYGTDDALDVLRRYGPELEPDLVLLGFTLGNDVRNNLLQGHCRLEEGRLACEPLERLSRGRFLWKRWRSELANRSQLYQLWRAATDTHWSQREEARAGVAPGLDPDLAFAIDAHREPEPEYLAQGLALTAALFEALGREAEALGAPLWVVVFPTRDQVEDARWELFVRAADGAPLARAGPQRAIARAARAAGLEVIDPLASFLERARREALFFQVDAHFSEKGHAAVAESIATALRARHPAFRPDLARPEAVP
jgi:lysophospholipase L1-like esterase